MRLEVRSQNAEISEVSRSLIERRLRFVLGRFASRIRRVTVHMNGSHGSADKRCRIVVRLVRSGQICVEGSDTDADAVVKRTTDRVGQLVSRELRRQREYADHV